MRIYLSVNTKESRLLVKCPISKFQSTYPVIPDFKIIIYSDYNYITWNTYKIATSSKLLSELDG